MQTRPRRLHQLRQTKTRQKMPYPTSLQQRRTSRKNTKLRLLRCAESIQKRKIRNIQRWNAPTIPNGQHKSQKETTKMRAKWTRPEDYYSKTTSKYNPDESLMEHVKNVSKQT